ncbi:AbgT family transporter [uncultured Brevibacillus sp.]|uniref:AbgT family transporter n=1 Tax=uncultured Brevibacillus sp. TaxID=169970 RepID=UPI0025989440|nr:AbgT family transporter [uncultured Brevibacillus sp.]
MAKLQPNEKTSNVMNGNMMRFLNMVERLGNRIPHPFTLFLYLTLFVIVVSWIGNYLDLSVVHPSKGEEIAVKSLVSKEGLEYFLGSMVDNFTSFKPLGLVLVIALGIGMADKVGLFEATIKKALINAPKSLITYAVLFIGILGNLASDAAYVIVPPLAAMIFYSVGRHPVAGLATGIAGVGCGFTANFFIAGTDVLLSGITTEVSKAIDPTVVVTPVDNWFFMSASVVLLTIVGAFVTDKIIEPRLGTYQEDVIQEKMASITPLENKALRNTLLVALVFICFVVLIVFIPNSPLRGENGSIMESPFMSGIIVFILAFFLLTGYTYGRTMGVIKKAEDAINFMSQSIKDMSGFVVLVFVVSQFIAFLNWSNVTVWLAVKGADLLKTIQLDGLPLIIVFVLVSTLLNLLITSGSAQWSIMAPIFVPMFMLMDFHPAFVQVAFRIGDSATNFITPMQPFVAVMLAFLVRYDKKAGLGTHIALILPYTVAFLIAWIAMLCIFAIFEIPVGPGVSMHL